MTETTTTRLRDMSKEEAKELLRTDIAQWNELLRAELREDADYEVDLSDIRLPYGAYLRGADLRGAYLRGADLQGADLQGAYLEGEYLQGADLQGAYLQGAYLQGADLRGAYLRGADLRGADLQGAASWDHFLWSFRQDFFSILDHAPAEVAALREQMVAGRIDGSTYSGECACLCGTVAKVHLQGDRVEHGDTMRVMKEMGIKPDGSRPAEQWFMSIGKGDVPALEQLEAEKPDWKNEGQFRVTLALSWLDEWVESRTAIAKALAA